MSRKLQNSMAEYPGKKRWKGFLDAFKNVFRQFYDSLGDQGSGKEYDYAALRDGLHEMILCESVYESAMSGRWVEIRE